MTLTPCDFAFAAIAAPEPESRFTSSSTFAPFVIACSACCCWADLSPSALVIVDFTPAASNAFLRNGRSTVSQRVDDFESGSKTATLPLDLLLLLLLPLLLPLLSLPQAATGTASARAAAPSTSCFLPSNFTWFLLVGWTTDAAPGAPRDARTAEGPGRARRAPALALRARPRRSARLPRPARSRTGRRPLASDRAGPRPPRPGLRPRRPCRD